MDTHSKSPLGTLLRGCGTLGNLRERLIRDYPHADDQDGFLEVTSRLLICICSDMKALSHSKSARGFKIIDQLYVMALELQHKVDDLTTAVEEGQRSSARKTLQASWVAMLDGLHKLEAIAGPIALEKYFGQAPVSTEQQNEKPEPKVFLSYSHADREVVEPFRRDLISRGLDVWWDRLILPGQDWEHEIKLAIEKSTAVIICFSKRIETTNRSGVFPEVLKALEIYRQFQPGRIFLIPVRLNDCEIPRFKIDGVRDLQSLQFQDLFPPDHRIQAITNILKAIRMSSSRTLDG